MDRVRFGRALGAGARETAKALLKAVDAAAAPDPSAKTQPQAARPGPSAGARAAYQVERVRSTSAGMKRGGRRFGEAIWKPFAKAGGILWLEVTGVLFALFAVAAAVAAWNGRANLRGAGTPMHHEWAAVAMLIVFGYFTVSSYVTAARRQRR